MSGPFSQWRQQRQQAAAQTQAGGPFSAWREQQAAQAQAVEPAPRVGEYQPGGRGGVFLGADDDLTGESQRLINQGYEVQEGVADPIAGVQAVTIRAPRDTVISGVGPVLKGQSFTIDERTSHPEEVERWGRYVRYLRQKGLWRDEAIRIRDERAQQQEQLARQQQGRVDRGEYDGAAKTFLRGAGGTFEGLGSAPGQAMSWLHDKAAQAMGLPAEVAKASGMPDTRGPGELRDQAAEAQDVAARRAQFEREQKGRSLLNPARGFAAAGMAGVEDQSLMEMGNPLNVARGQAFGEAKTGNWLVDYGPELAALALSVPGLLEAGAGLTARGLGAAADAGLAGGRGVATAERMAEALGRLNQGALGRGLTSASDLISGDKLADLPGKALRGASGALRAGGLRVADAMANVPTKQVAGLASFDAAQRASTRLDHPWLKGEHTGRLGQEMLSRGVPAEQVDTHLADLLSGEESRQRRALESMKQFMDETIATAQKRGEVARRTTGEVRLDKARGYGKTRADELATGDQAFRRYEAEKRAEELRQQIDQDRVDAPAIRESQRQQIEMRADKEASEQAKWERLLQEREAQDAGRFAGQLDQHTKRLEIEQPFKAEVQDVADEKLTNVMRGAPVEDTVDPFEVARARRKFDKVAADADQQKQAWLAEGERKHQEWKAEKKRAAEQAAADKAREQGLVDAVEASPMRDDRPLVPGVDTDEILDEMRKSRLWRELDPDIRAEIERRRSAGRTQEAATGPDTLPPTASAKQQRTAEKGWQSVEPYREQPTTDAVWDAERVKLRRSTADDVASAGDTVSDASSDEPSTPQQIVAKAGRIQGKGRGRMPSPPGGKGKVLGFYSPQAQTSQVDNEADVGTAFHEYAHEIVDKGGVDLKGLPKPMQAALTKWSGSHNGTLEEGFAEAVGRWVRGDRSVPADARKWIDEYAKTPGGKRIREARKQYAAYWGASPLDRMRMHTAKPGERPKATEGDPVVTAWSRLADRRYGMKRLLTDMGFKAPDNAANLDPVAIFDATNKTAGERAYRLISEGNYYGPSGFRDDLKGLPQINDELSKAVKDGSVEDVLYYMLAKRSAQKGAEGVKTPFQTREGTRYTPDEMIKYAEDKYGGKLESAVKAVQDLNAAALQRAVEVGLVSKESFDRMREADPFYMSMLRALPAEAFAGARGGQPSVLKPMKGSMQHKVLHPVEGMLLGAELLTRAADRAYVVQRFGDLMQSTKGYGRFFVPFSETTAQVHQSVKKYRDELQKAGVKVKDLGDVETAVADIAAMATGRDDIVHVYRDGQKYMARLPKEVVEMFRAVPPSSLPAVAAIGGLSRSVTGLFKKSVVDWNPFFVAKNIARDFMTTLSKRGPVEGTKLFARGASLAAKDVAKQFPWYKDGKVEYDKYSEMLIQAYRASGMRSSGWYSTPDRAKQLWRQLNGDKSIRERLGVVASLPEVVAMSEHIARIGAFEKQLKDAGWSGKGMPTESQMIAATNAAAEITTDFRRSGIYSEWANRHVPFLNAAVQSSVNFYEHMKTDPKAALAKGAATVTAISVLEWARNHDKTWYKELSDAERNAFWFTETPFGIIRVPKPFEQGAVFGSVPSAMLQAAFDSDEEVAGLLTEAAKSITPPVDPSAMTPAVIRPAVEWWGNKSLWTGKPITNEMRKGKVAPENMAKPSTPELYKSVGRMLRFLDSDLVSPDALQHFTRGHVKVADDMIRAADSGGLDTGFKYRPGSGQSERELYDMAKRLKVEEDRYSSESAKQKRKRIEAFMREEIAPLRDQLRKAKSDGASSKELETLNDKIQAKARQWLADLRTGS